MNKEELIELLEPTVKALGYELIDIDLRIGQNGLLRLFIDSVPGVTLSDCELVSRHLSDWLDVEDPLPGAYVLEVSSPGIDRRLRTSEHFAAVVGEEVRVELGRAVSGRRRFRGRLVAVDDSEIELEVDGELWHLPLADLSIARLVPVD